MHNHSKPYTNLFVMAVLSFIAMYILMYAMVDSLSNVFMNVNQFYMAALMTAPMVLIELLVMKGMYENKSKNVVIVIASLVVLITCFLLIRRQTGVTDKQFLRSMIPHHGGAVLMCEQSPLEDAEIKALCENIITGQQAEIDWMKQKLNTL